MTSMFERFDSLSGTSRTLIISALSATALGTSLLISNADKKTTVYADSLVSTHICEGDVPTPVKAGEPLSDITKERGYTGGQATAFELNTLERIGQQNLIFDDQKNEFVVTETATVSLAECS